jgi:hypothetical protein
MNIEDHYFFLTSKQQTIVEEWIKEQNTEYCNNLLEDPNLPSIIRESITKSIENGFPMPPYELNIGFYSISFTPASFGNRIYVHHHLTNKSFKIYDVDDLDLEFEQIAKLQEQNEEVKQVEVEIV